MDEDGEEGGRLKGVRRSLVRWGNFTLLTVAGLLSLARLGWLAGFVGVFYFSVSPWRGKAGKTGKGKEREGKGGKGKGRQRDAV